MSILRDTVGVCFYFVLCFCSFILDIVLFKGTSPLSKEEQEWKLPMNWKLFIDDCRLSKAFLLFVGYVFGKIVNQKKKLFGLFVDLDPV